MILLRHGQSEFNVHIAASRRDPGIADPRLTEFGFVQARRAAHELADMDVRRIVTSPYARALQTASVVNQVFDVPVLVHPIVRERFGFVCDIGSPRSQLYRAWPAYDFSLVQEIWWPAIDEPVDSVSARATLFRAEAEALGDWSRTLVISHWGFILAMTGQSIGNCQWIRTDPSPPGRDD